MENDRGIMLDLSYLNITSVLSAFDEGVIITDENGRILFYNETQEEIDDLEQSYVLGKKVTDIYNLDKTQSMIMRCLGAGEPILGHIFFYRTCRGKSANTIHSVFPLFSNNRRLVGSICFVKNYNILEKTVAAVSGHAPHRKRRLGNGTRFTFTDIVGQDANFLRVVTIARLAADSPSPIMLYGETGTGKELFAQSIHNYSSRHRNPFVGINCAAIPENLLEGLLFGTVKGAFTGSVNKEGIFEQAGGGTLFLDEVNSMPINLQSKLLRALQEKKIRRVGGCDDIDIDVKIISSVNADPHQAIKTGELRMDLFYRLGVVFIRIPPLREREGAVELLARHFVYKNNLSLGRNVHSVSDEVFNLFRQYPWPGNVRELEHIIEGAMNMMGEEDRLSLSHLPFHFLHPDFRELFLTVAGKESREPSAAAGREEKRREKKAETAPFATPVPVIPVSGGMKEIQKNREREMVENALTQTEGNISRAARVLGVSRQLLHYKIRRYGLDRRNYFKGKA